MSEIGFEEAERQGDLDSNLHVYDGEPWKVKLSEQALKRMNRSVENRDGSIHKA
jgi:hypothetical protein